MCQINKRQLTPRKRKRSMLDRKSPLMVDKCVSFLDSPQWNGVDAGGIYIFSSRYMARGLFNCGLRICDSCTYKHEFNSRIISIPAAVHKCY